jgi:hypothetical protein
MRDRCRHGLLLLGVLATCLSGCLHQNPSPAPPTAPSPAPEVAPPSGPLTLIPDGTWYRPWTGVNLTLALDVPQRPDWCFATINLVDRHTGAVVRRASPVVTFSPDGRSTELRDVFDSRSSIGKDGECLPEGEFLLVAAVSVGKDVYEAKQPVKVEVYSGGNCVKRVPLLPFLPLLPSLR